MMAQPMPMYGSSYVFSKNFFRFWVALTFLWAFGATLVITILPLWEGRHSIAKFCNFVRGKGDGAADSVSGSEAEAKVESVSVSQEKI